MHNTIKNVILPKMAEFCFINKYQVHHANESIRMTNSFIGKHEPPYEECHFISLFRSSKNNGAYRTFACNQRRAMY